MKPFTISQSARLVSHTNTGRAAAVAMGVEHDPGSVTGPGCDDQFEFEFALDLQLDAIERLHDSGWRSSVAKAAHPAT